jgi:hypothetical protein
MKDEKLFRGRGGWVFAALAVNGITNARIFGLPLKI